MIGTDLERLRLPHDKPNFSSNLMLQKFDSASASLLPLIPIFIESVKLRFPKIKSKQIGFNFREGKTNKERHEKEKEGKHKA